MSKYSFINLIAQVSMFVVNLCISFFLVPYLTETIGVEAYGFVGLANDFIGYAQLITVALNSMASRFITIRLKENNIEDANKFYSSVIIANIILSVILAIFGVIFIIFMQYLIDIPSHLLLDVKLLFVFIFANFIVSIITSTFAVATFCTNKLYLTSIKTIISQIIRAVLLLVLFFLFKPAAYYIGIATLICTIYLGYCNYRYSKVLTPELEISRKYFNIKYVKTLISSGIWNSFSRLSSILSNGLDLLISNIFIGSVGMGIISCSKTLPTTILNLFGQIANIFAPELTISYAKKDYQKLKEQLLFAIKFLGLLSAVPIIILFAYGKEFFTLWVPSQDASLLYILSCASVLGMCFSLQLEPLWNIFTVTNKVKNSSLFLFMNAIVTIIVVFIFLNVFKTPIARMLIIVATSTIVSVIRSLTFLPIYGAKCVNLKGTTFYPAIVKNLIVIIVGTIISILFKKIFAINNWMKLIIAAIISTCISITLSLFIGNSKEDRINLKNTLLNIVKRNGVNES